MQSPVAAHASWSRVEKIGFRFAFCFFSLFIAFMNNGAFPLWSYFYQATDWFMRDVVNWTGANLLSIDYKIASGFNGSGDTTYMNVLLFCIAVAALIGTIIWSFADRKRSSYTRLYYWLTVAVRYYVAFMLFNYGMIKIFKMQFPDPDLYRLTETYGSSTPMGLAWTFLGFSRGYNLFIGIAELCALFLLFRRTMIFGGIITLMTTLNIMAVNYFYDVPVKMLSTALVVMTLFLLSRDMRRMFDFFFRGKAVELPVITEPAISNKWVRRGKFAVKHLLIGYVVIAGIIHCTSMVIPDDNPRHMLYGYYTVSDFEVHPDSVRYDMTPRWEQVIISDGRNVTVRMENDSTGRFGIRIYPNENKLVFVPANPAAKNNRCEFFYDMSDSTNIILHGRNGADSLSMVMSRQDVDTAFALTNAAFHWISDKPNNR